MFIRRLLYIRHHIWLPQGVQKLVRICFWAYIVILEFNSEGIAMSKSFEPFKTMEGIYSNDQPYQEILIYYKDDIM